MRSTRRAVKMCMLFIFSFAFSFFILGKEECHFVLYLLTFLFTSFHVYIANTHTQSPQAREWNKHSLCVDIWYAVYWCNRTVHIKAQTNEFPTTFSRLRQPPPHSKFTLRCYFGMGVVKLLTFDRIKWVNERSLSRGDFESAMRFAKRPKSVGLNAQPKAVGVRNGWPGYVHRDVSWVSMHARVQPKEIGYLRIREGGIMIISCQEYWIFSIRPQFIS